MISWLRIRGDLTCTAFVAALLLTPLHAFAATAPVNADAGKQATISPVWGSLADLAGTTWRSDNGNLSTYDWVVPNEVLRLVYVSGKGDDENYSIRLDAAGRVLKFHYEAGEATSTARAVRPGVIIFEDSGYQQIMRITPKSIFHEVIRDGSRKEWQQTLVSKSDVPGALALIRQEQDSWRRAKVDSSGSAVQAELAGTAQAQAVSATAAQPFQSGEKQIQGDVSGANVPLKFRRWGVYAYLANRVFQTSGGTIIKEFTWTVPGELLRYATSVNGNPIIYNLQWVEGFGALSKKKDFALVPSAEGIIAWDGVSGKRLVKKGNGYHDEALMYDMSTYPPRGKYDATRPLPPFIKGPTVTYVAFDPIEAAFVPAAIAAQKESERAEMAEYRRNVAAEKAKRQSESGGGGGFMSGLYGVLSAASEVMAGEVDAAENQLEDTLAREGVLDIYRGERLPGQAPVAATAVAPTRSAANSSSARVDAPSSRSPEIQLTGYLWCYAYDLESTNPAKGTIYSSNVATFSHSHRISDSGAVKQPFVALMRSRLTGTGEPGACYVEDSMAEMEAFKNSTRGSFPGSRWEDVSFTPKFIPVSN